MRKLILTVFAVISVIAVHAQPVWISANSIGAVTSPDTPTFTAKDAQGNLYVSSNFSGTKTFGPNTQTALGSYDAYVVKYDASGNFVWFHQFGAASAFVVAGGLATDGAGNVYITGNFINQIVLGTTVYPSAGSRDIFMVKLDGAGAFQWGKSIGGTGSDESFGISVAGNKIYLTGNYSTAFTDGSVTVPTASGNEDILVATYNRSTGACVNMIHCGGAQTDISFGISASTNAVYVTGYFIGAAAFGTINLTSANTTGPNPTSTPDMFLIKLDSSLAILWALKAGAGSTDQGNGVSQDAAGNAYVAGYFLRTVNFGNSVSLVEANGYGDGFLVKYSPSGVCQWGNKISSGVSDVSVCVSTDPQGSSYVGGSFGATATLSGAASTNIVLVSAGTTDGFIAKWTTDGKLRWAIKAGSSTDDRTQSIVYDNNGFCQFVVNYSNSITPGTLAPIPAPSGGGFAQLVSSVSGGTVGLHENISNVAIKLYPNPTSNGIVTIETSSTVQIRYVAVYSIEGKLMMENNYIGGSSVTLTTSDLISGQYIVSIQTTAGTVTQQLHVN